MAGNEHDGVDEATTELQIATNSQSAENAINRIEELANALIDTVRFSEGLQEDFQELATSLAELETSRRDLREELEVQTIKASVKRHALRTQPAIYQRELEEAVLAARTSNAATIQLLQSQMTAASEDTEKTLKRQEILQMENTKFIPERDEVTKQHDEIIAALNQRMADKASKQIKLNETRDILRETSLGMNEFGLGMQNLQEDMEIFRAESQADEKQLQNDVAQTQEAILQQKEKNLDEKRGIDQLLDRILDMDGRLDVVLKDVRRTENSKSRLEMQSIQLAETINREKILNQQTSEEVAMLEGARDKQKMGYEEKIRELEEKLKLVDLEFVGVNEKHKELVKVKDESFLKKEEAVRRKSKAQAAVRESAREVQVMKHKTTALIEKSAHLSQENTQCQEDLEALDENHAATMDTFNQQIVEYQSNLDIETTEKLKVKEEQEETEKVLDNFRTEQVKFMNDMTTKIEAGRRQHKKLAKESNEFNQSIAENRKKIESLLVELELVEKGMVMMKKELEMEIERLQTSIELYKTENEKKGAYLEEKKPVLQALEVELEEIGEEYSKVKNEVVAIRNKQKSIQEQMNRTQVMVDRLAKPQAKLKADIKSCRISSLAQLKESANDRKNQEAEIYDRTQKLENVVQENTKFETSCNAKSEVVDDIHMDIKAHGHYQSFLLKELRQLETRFMAAWDICVAMEKESAEHDAKILQGINELQQETKDRCMVLTGISEQLNGEMEVLTGFLDNVNSRRPKDTRQEKRKSLRPTPPATRPSMHMRLRKPSTPFPPLPPTSSHSLHRASRTQIAKA